MFKVSKNRVIEWPVIINAPVAGGGVSKHKVVIQFEDIPQSEQEDIYNKGGNDRDLMRRVVKGWEPGQFKDESDSDIIFSEDNLNMLLEAAYVCSALTAAYLELHNGRAAARKN
jgi:hypothetical protein